jgi:hypothetical protein
VTAVDAPTKPQFKVEWTDDDAAWVVLLPTDSDTLKPVKIGTVGFNGREWFFWRIDPDGEVVMDTGHFIDVDPDQRMEIHNLTADAEKEIDDAVKEAKRAAAKAKAAMYRDEQKELVVLAAHVHARRWLPLFLQLQSGCTGWFDKDGTVSHDDATCPVHENVRLEGPVVADAKRARHLHRNGFPPSEIAEKLGVTEGEARRLINDHT